MREAVYLRTNLTIDNVKIMKIKNLTLKNIGPFQNATLNFFKNEESDSSPVTIITGENGTGKTVILDAIRGLLFGSWGTLGRNIIKYEKDFMISGGFTNLENSAFFGDFIINATKINSNNPTSFDTNQMQFNAKYANINQNKGDIWITNYWTSKTSNDSFKLSSLSSLQPEQYLLNSLNGIQDNVEVLKLICSFDYLRSSDSPKEKQEGQFLFDILKKIIKLSLTDGEFRYVERKTLMPIVSQMGAEVSLDKLSSGNLYLIQRLISLLGQMYSVYTLNNLELNQLCKTPGLLLIDEAENHLHPKWQKTFLNSILDIFPSLQIIVTTHSPFIVSSVENAKIFVCKSMKDCSVIEDATAEYSNKPIEEILLSPIFDTNSFNQKIEKLLIQRKEAIEAQDYTKIEKIEQELKEINPEYFSYFDVENLLDSITK